MTELSRYPAAVLKRFASRVFERVGLPAHDAMRVAELMTQADLSGADGHGIFRLPQYVRRIQAGGVNIRPEIRVNRTASATALVDGDNGMGHLVMSRAAETAIELAREAGVGWAGVRGSNHAGPAALYATMPLEHGMIGIYLAVGNANHMPAWGGRENILSTNPIAIAVPTGDEPPLVLDMATSVAAYGKVKQYAQRGEAMPEGWMVDAEGQPLTDPARAGEGVLLPIGGYKGSGLAIAFGVLAGVLNGAAFGRDVIDFNADDRSATNTGHAIVALDIARFMPADAFRRAVDRHVRDIRATERLPGVDAILMPGERRHGHIRERTARGVPLPAPLVAELDRVAETLAVEPLPCP